MGTSNPNKLLPLIDYIESNIENSELRDSKVSQSNIAWQLDHVLKVINKVSEVLIQSNPETYKRNFNLGRFLILSGGYIPRGAAQAPDVVMPPSTISKEDIRNQVALARTLISQITGAAKNANFTHFAFGQMNKAQTLRFLEVHTKHHLKIVRDILKP